MTVKHPVYGNISFPDDATEQEMADAMRKLDAQQQPAKPERPGIGAMLANAAMPMSTTAAPASPMSREELAAQVAAERRGLANVPRYGGAILGSTGGPTGALMTGGGEAIAQAIEGDMRPGEIANSAMLGAVPLGSAKGVVGAVKDAAKMGAVAASGEAYRELLDGDKNGSPAMTGGITAATTAVSPLIGKVLGAIINYVTPQERARLAEEILNNKNKDAVLATMKGRGAVVVPSSVNPSIKNRVLESIAGIQNVEGGVARANQPVFNAIGREEASIPANVEINRNTLAAARNEIGKDNYTLLRQGGGGQLLDNWRDATTKLKAAQAELNKGFTNARGAAVDKAQQAVNDAADILNNTFGGNPSAMAELEAAKKAFGKNYDVEEAVLSGTDEVRPAVLSQMLENRGEAGLTGGLRDIAQFNNAFGRSAKNPNKLATAPGAASAGTALVAGNGNPAATAALVGGVPLVRGAIRDMLVSPEYQAANAVRNYRLRTSADPETVAALARISAIIEANRQKNGR